MLWVDKYGSLCILVRIKIHINIMPFNPEGMLFTYTYRHNGGHKITTLGI